MDRHKIPSESSLATRTKPHNYRLDFHPSFEEEPTTKIEDRPFYQPIVSQSMDKNQLTKISDLKFRSIRCLLMISTKSHGLRHEFTSDVGRHSRAFNFLSRGFERVVKGPSSSIFLSLSSKAFSLTAFDSSSFFRLCSLWARVSDDALVF